MSTSMFALARREARERSDAYERQALAYAGEAAKAAAGGGSIVERAMGVGGGGNTLAAAYPGMFDQRQMSRAAESYQYFRHWVYVAISCIARRLSGQALRAGYQTGAVNGSPTKPQRTFRSRKAAAWEVAGFPRRIKATVGLSSGFEIIADHPALLDLEHPNPVQRKAEFITMWVANLLLTGEAYILSVGEADAEGEADEAAGRYWAIPTAWVSPVHEDGLFASYRLHPPGLLESISVPAEMIARTYFPDPSNIKSCTSPIWTQISAIRTDDAIQTSQEDAFHRGIFPNVAIRIGQTIGEDGKPTGARPTLEGSQRRQIIRAVRQVWDRSAANGDPAILDGLIEDIFKLHNTPQEMDWLQSGEQTKNRILMAFGLHPLLVGEAMNVGGYSQAAVIEQIAADNVFNPIADAFSVMATDFIALRYEPAGLQIWLDPVKPRNEEMQSREWLEGRKNGDITRDEWRAERVNLPALGSPEESKLVNNPASMQGTVAVLTAVSKGDIAADSAKEIFKTFLKKDDAEAEALLGSTKEKPSKPTPQSPMMLSGPVGVDGGKKGHSLRLSRSAIVDSHVKALSLIEEGVADAMQAFFRTPDKVHCDGDETTGPAGSSRVGKESPAKGKATRRSRRR